MAKTVEITAKLPKKDGVAGRENDKVATISLNCFGETLEEDIKLVGPEVIKSNYEANAIITAQGGVRRDLERGKTQDEIQALMKDYKPGQAVRRGVDVVGGYKAWFAALSPEDKKKEIAKLREMQA